MADNIIEIRNEYEIIKTKLDSLIFGSIEIRKQNNRKYIYVHFRDAGLLRTKYAGEYSDELFNLIIQNNYLAKELKIRQKKAQQRLDSLSFTTSEINDDVKLNIDLARRNLVDSIYKQAMLEGVATTYSDTETLVNGGRVNKMAALDIQKVINLKHAWEFIIDRDVISYPSNYALLCQINGIVEEAISYSAGKIRSTPVTIGGSSYIPPIPFENKVKEDLEAIKHTPGLNEIDKAVELIIYIMKTQAFLDGNKRTAVIFGNHYLISHGLGLIVVPVDQLSEYKKLIIEYYENRSNDIKTFFKLKCFINLK